MDVAQRIVNVSGGMASAIALFRTLERYGHEGTLAVFADTLSESADTYRFLDDVKRVAGIEITQLSDGRNIWDVFFQQMYIIGLHGGCVASGALKKKPLAKFATKNGTIKETTIMVGLGPSELERQQRLTKALAPWRVDYPLNWGGYSHHCDMMEELRSHGIEPPSSYALGYPHNNCSGACVLAGIGQWCGLLRDDPKLYAKNEQQEHLFLDELRKRNRTVITILKDRRGGEVNNLSLRQLREEIEAGTRLPTDTWRASTCSCMGRLFAD